MAKGLGWLSIGLGLAELIAPRQLARAIGVRPRELITRLLGLREIGSGLGILTQRRPVGWLWSRVGGDAMDLALLGAAARENETDESRLEVATAAVAGVTLLDLFASVWLSRSDSPPPEAAVQTITIGRSPEEIYSFWRKLENLPRVMPDLESVRETGPRSSHWVVRGPGRRRMEWDAVITTEQPNECIAWRSRPNGVPGHSGKVSFVQAPGDRGTIVRVEMTYDSPGGSIGRSLAKLVGQAPEQKIQLDLYRLKQILETGMITTTEGQPAGRSSSTSSLYDWGTTRG